MTAIRVDTSSSINNVEIERMLWATPNVCRDAWMHWAMRPQWQMRKPARSRKSARKMRRKYASKG